MSLSTLTCCDSRASRKRVELLELLFYPFQIFPSLSEYVFYDLLREIFLQLADLFPITGRDAEGELPFRACGDDLGASANSHVERRSAPRLISSETARGRGSKKTLRHRDGRPLEPTPHESVGTPSTSANGWSALASRSSPDTESAESCTSVAVNTVSRMVNESP